uniref:Trypsin-like serine protease n=2 Tax=Stichopus japonicus TaxID=307972 RepID=G3M5Q3_STIJA|nr:trypsin-like serine protease [Apostichopus japonicus]
MMLLLFITVLAVANLQTTLAECGARKITSSAIVGGVDAYYGKWPWQVSIRVDYASGSGNYHTCGGTLINKDYVLTANHCFDPLIGKPDPTEYEIVVGNHREDTIDQHQESFYVAEIITHSDYRALTMDNDITLLKLTSSVTFNDYIQPACLPSLNYGAGTDTWITGWGNQETVIQKETLQEVSVPIIDTATCNQKTWYDGEVTDNMFCAGLAEGGKDSCQGDSGGPVVVVNTEGFYEVIGVTSWGYGCADAKNPGVYTRVFNYVDWIAQNTGA